MRPAPFDSLFVSVGEGVGLGFGMCVQIRFSLGRGGVTVMNSLINLVNRPGCCLGFWRTRIYVIPIEFVSGSKIRKEKRHTV